MEIDLIEVVSLIASIASLVLAVIAIWLSFKFFEKSSEASAKTIDASKSVNSSVEKLEKLFDKLYSDTFSMMKDTVSDMRKHIWNGDESSNTYELEEELEKKAQSKVDKLKTDLSQDISKMFSNQNKTDFEIEKLRLEFTELINKAVIQSRNIENEAKEETLRNYIIRTYRILRKSKKKILVDNIIDKAIDEHISPKEIVDELSKMKEDAIIDFEGTKINSGLLEIKIK